MKNFIKFILSLIIILTSLLGCVVALCVIDPTLADDIAAILYKDKTIKAPYEGDTSLLNDSEGSGYTPSVGNTVKAPEVQEAAESPENRSVSATPQYTKGLDDAIAGNAPEPSYITPSRDQLNIPQEMKGRSDYQTIVVNEAQVEDDSAAVLKRALDVGETGDGLSFDPLFYPYYNMLNDTGKHIYRQIYANAMARNGNFSPVEPIGKSGLRTVIEALFNDQPQLFWMDTSYSCKYRSSGECVEIDLAFNRTASDFERENALFMQAARNIEAQAASYASDADKERFAHDAIIDMVDYVRSAEMSQSAYSALVNKKSVCAGYARAYQLIMQELGIPCYYCVGSAGEDHAWNIVKLDDGFYNVDLTWDDTDGGHYDYFNKTDEDYAPTHVRTDLSVRLPACNATKYRQENEDPAERSRRSLAEAGFDQGDVLYDLKTYYNNCSFQIRNLGLGTHNFKNLVGGEELFKEIERVYNGEEYREAYLTDAMRAIGSSSCKMSMEIERLKGDIYLISHNISLT